MTAVTGRVERPASVIAVRVVAGIQVAIGVSLTALSGFALIYLLVTTFDSALGNRHRSLLVPVLCLAAGVLLSFGLLAGLSRLRRFDPVGRRIIAILETLLGVSIVVFVLTAGSRSLFVWVPSMVDLMCAVVVLALAQTSELRGWTSTSV